MSRGPRSEFPAWRHGPNGEKRIFKAAADVPEGWTARPGQAQKPPAAPSPVAETPKKTGRGRPKKPVLSYEEAKAEAERLGFEVPEGTPYDEIVQAIKDTTNGGNG